MRMQKLTAQDFKGMNHWQRLYLINARMIIRRAYAQAREQIAREKKKKRQQKEPECG